MRHGSFAQGHQGNKAAPPFVIYLSFIVLSKGSFLLYTIASHDYFLVGLRAHNREKLGRRWGTYRLLEDHYTVFIFNLSFLEHFTFTACSLLGHSKYLLRIISHITHRFKLPRKRQLAFQCLQCRSRSPLLTP